MSDDFTEETPNFVRLYDALDERGSGLVATLIEAHGITAEDRYGRTGHRAPGSAEAQAALDLCASRHQFLIEWWRATGYDLDPPPETHQWAGGWESPLSDAGWPLEKFPQLLAAAEQARVDAVGPVEAEKESEAAVRRRREDQTKRDATNDVLLGAVLAILRGEVKDARDKKPVSCQNDAQIQRVLVALKDADNNFRGLSPATIERRFADAKVYFPLKGCHVVALGS